MGLVKLGLMQVDPEYVHKFMAVMVSMMDHAKRKRYKWRAHKMSSSEEDSYASTVLNRGQGLAPLSASTRLDMLLQEYEEFFEGDETFGPPLPLHVYLAGLIDKVLRCKLSNGKLC